MGMNIIIAHIDEIRKSKGLSKKKMADLIGISRSTINNWYYADTTPALANIQNICEAFELTVEQFFGGIGNPEVENSEREFLGAWRMLTEQEKAVIASALQAFREAKDKS